MAGISCIIILTLGFTVATSKPTIRDSFIVEEGFCRSACWDNEICKIQYIVKATITGKQGLFLSPDYRSKFNFGGMTDEERNRTLEMYGEYRYSLDTLEVVMSDPFWKFPVTDLPLDVPVTAIRCGVNLEIGSTYILYGYFSGWMATDNERRALWLDECTLPVEINESDPVPRRFLERTC